MKLTKHPINPVYLFSLYIKNMRINAWDETFAVREITNDGFSALSDAYPALGKALSCSEQSKGSFSIDLRGTGFYIPNTVRKPTNENPLLLVIGQSSKTRILHYNEYVSTFNAKIPLSKQTDQV